MSEIRGMVCKILLYNLSPEKDTKLKMLCRKMNITARSVEKHEYGQEIGYLLGLTDNSSSKDGEDFDDEMLYISGLGGGMLNLFLDQLRRKKLIIPLKAVQTETNLHFTSRELYRELSAEREAISMGTYRHQGE